MNSNEFKVHFHEQSVFEFVSCDYKGTNELLILGFENKCFTEHLLFP